MEVCVDNIQSAINAFKGGASRLELCSALSEGGLTPTVGFMKEVKKLVQIPVFVMIRARTGNNYMYSHNEIEMMKYDMRILKENGADGFVFGALTRDRQIDVDVCQQFLEIACHLPMTFHRAFDYSKNPIKAMDNITQLGFKRILTSGQCESAEKGVSLIKELISAANGRIIIMPGSGVSEHNLKRILTETKCIEFHGSAKKQTNLNHFANGVKGNQELKLGDNDHIMITDEDLVKKMVEIYENR